MNRYTASYTTNRTRTIVETATVETVIESDGFAGAGALAEAGAPSFLRAEFTAVSDRSVASPAALSSIAFDSAVPEAAAAETDSGQGLTPARYEASPAPSGSKYFPVQVEPTPIV